MDNLRVVAFRQDETKYYIQYIDLDGVWTSLPRCPKYESMNIYCDSIDIFCPTWIGSFDDAVKFASQFVYLSEIKNYEKEQNAQFIQFYQKYIASKSKPKSWSKTLV